MPDLLDVLLTLVVIDLGAFALALYWLFREWAPQPGEDE